MSRHIVDTLGACERLVVAVGIQGELADEFALRSDDTDALIGDQELDLTSLVGSPQPDFDAIRDVAGAVPRRVQLFGSRLTLLTGGHFDSLAANGPSRVRRLGSPPPRLPRHGPHLNPGLHCWIPSGACRVRLASFASPPLPHEHDLVVGFRGCQGPGGRREVAA